MTYDELRYPTAGETLPNGDPMPILIEHVPPEPVAGDVREDSYARPPLGDGEGPRLPTVVEQMRANYELGLDSRYSDTGESR